MLPPEVRTPLLLLCNSVGPGPSPTERSSLSAPRAAQPDLVLVEFGVNDVYPETDGADIEALVRSHNGASLTDSLPDRNFRPCP